MITKCEGCNEPIDNKPAGAYGGDWYSSCNICDWHSEGDGHTTIKQGLTLEELVAHKKKLNKLYDRLYNLCYRNKKQSPEDMLMGLGRLMNELIDREE